MIAQNKDKYPKIEKSFRVIIWLLTSQSLKRAQEEVVRLVVRCPMIHCAKIHAKIPDKIPQDYDRE